MSFRENSSKQDKAECFRLEESIARVGKLKDKTYMLFALAKIRDDLGIYHDSFSVLLEANQLKSRLQPHKLKQLAAPLRQYKDEFWQQMGKNKVEAYEGIFIVGMPRSGTTLVEQTLLTSFYIKSYGETAWIGKAFQELNLSDKQSFNSLVELARRYIPDDPSDSAHYQTLTSL